MLLRRYDTALAQRDLANSAISEVTSGYADHRLMVGSSGGLTTECGDYRVRGDFHITSSNRGWREGGGTGSWICNTCWTVADTECNKEECHRC